MKAAEFDHEADLMPLEVYQCVVEPAELEGQVLEHELGWTVDARGRGNRIVYDRPRSGSRADEILDHVAAMRRKRDLGEFAATEVGGLATG